jgi:hypothetical protein
MSLDTVRSVDGSFLLDDFERMSGATILQQWVPSSRWYIKAPSGDVSRMQPSSGNDADIAATHVFAAGYGHVWQIHVLPTTDTTQRATLGVQLGAAGRCAKLDSITLLGRGPVKLRVHFVTSVWGGGDVDVSLDSNWSRQSIDPMNMQLFGGLKTPAEVLAQTDRIELIVLDTSEVNFALDDMRLWGFLP